MEKTLPKGPLVHMAERRSFLQAIPCFAVLSPEQSDELAALMQEVYYACHDRIVVEHDPVDCIYIIVRGVAEVTNEVDQYGGKEQALVAMLGVGEGIGLNDMGFYSKTGKRTATVTATTAMLLLKLDIQDLYLFLQKHHLENALHATAENMLRVLLIKRSLPFSKLSHERLQWLASHVEVIHVPAGTVIFHQGEPGDRCYLIRSGQVDIFAKDKQGRSNQLALLKSPVLFGEATLITHTPRNATAVAKEDCELFVLQHQYLSELLETEASMANMFMTLMVDRSRPTRHPSVTVHRRSTSDGQEITILKNPDNGSYFKLSQEGAFIWGQLNGEHTMREITLELADRFNLFAPNVVAALISRLTKSGFINNIKLYDGQSKLGPVWMRTLDSIRRVLERRIVIHNADTYMAKLYKKYLRHCFTLPGQVILILLAVSGFTAFAMRTSDILSFFQERHAHLILLLGLIPLSLLTIVLRELGRAVAVKACHREVHYMGVGWYWFTPIAFTDTSDMWLADRGPRMLVNLAGIYTNVLVAGLVSLPLFFVNYSYVPSMLWLFALYTYIKAFQMLSPLQDTDGYYILVDWLETPHLRQNAVLWLVKKFPKALRQPTLFYENGPEIIYWVASILFLMMVTIVTLIVQAFGFIVLSIHWLSYIHLSLILPFLVAIFSSLRVIREIKKQAEE